MKYCWDQYIVIEKDFIDAKKYVSFIEENYEVESIFFRNEIVLLGSEIEKGLKRFVHLLDSSTNIGNIGQYKEHVLKYCPKIVDFQSKLIGTDEMFNPFVGWNSGKLEFWEQYDRVKHGLEDSYPTLNLALNMLAAYEIILHLIHLVENHNQGHQSVSYSLDECPLLLRVVEPSVGDFEGSSIAMNYRYERFFTCEKIGADE